MDVLLHCLDIMVFGVGTVALSYTALRLKGAITLLKQIRDINQQIKTQGDFFDENDER